jgi:hypothetical protein
MDISNFHAEKKWKVASKSSVAKELILDGQRFSFRGEEHKGYSHDKTKPF